MDQDEAAALLGVPSDATAETVRRAWRVWARIAHPDVGGDPHHFSRLDEARRQLLRAPAVQAPLQRRPRESLSSVRRRPAHPMLLAFAALVTVLLAAVPAEISAPLAVAALPAAIGATGWAFWATRAVLDGRADHGHRIATLAALWVPVAVAQVAVSILAGESIVPVLPLSALMIAAAVSAINPGAGLWRPTGQSSTFDPK